MRNPFSISLILLAIGVSLALVTGCAAKRDKGYFEDSDPEMVAAIAKARRTLPHFWQAYEKRDHGVSDFSLKIRITESNRIEHFWLKDIARIDGKVTGAIEHEPKIVSNVKLGQRLEIADEEIQDWYYMRDGKMVGNQTARPMMKKWIKTMSAKDAAAAKEFFADP
jgi:uncharacterized protein YegJ (DUF2314 family)